MVYNSAFARVYDIIVHHTDEALAGAAELEFLQDAFRHCSRPVRDILDAGYGQGRYLIPLVQAGFQVTGLDNSPDMLDACRQRLQQRGLTAPLVRADLTTLDIEQSYDALICVDSVICYLLETEQILSVLASFRRALRPGGFLILDIWNMLGQWELFGKTSSFSFESETIRVAWQERYEFDSFPSYLRGTYWGEFTENGVSQSFHHEETLRAMTIGEVMMYCWEAGFADVEAFPGYERSDLETANPEQLVFVAHSPF